MLLSLILATSSDKAFGEIILLFSFGCFISQLHLIGCWLILIVSAAWYVVHKFFIEIFANMLFLHQFRFNCGTKEVLTQFGYTPPPTNVERYNTPIGNNVMPVEFRWQLWGLVMGNLLAGMFYERVVVLGPVHTYLSKRFPVKRLQKVL